MWTAYHKPTSAGLLRSPQACLMSTPVGTFRQCCRLRPVATVLQSATQVWQPVVDEESVARAKLLQRLGFKIRKIIDLGDCQFGAVADQLWG